MSYWIRNFTYYNDGRRILWFGVISVSRRLQPCLSLAPSNTFARVYLRSLTPFSTSPQSVLLRGFNYNISGRLYLARSRIIFWRWSSYFALLLRVYSLVADVVFSACRCALPSPAWQMLHVNQKIVFTAKRVAACFVGIRTTIMNLLRSSLLIRIDECPTRIPRWSSSVDGRWRSRVL